MNIKLGPPKITDLKPRITVIGIGGAGCNAINNMIATQLDGVEFVVANTDAQSLSMSNAERRIQLGTNLTEGLGAGARPEVGEAAAREAEEAIRAEIAGSHMVFIAAGMGGGTGTGAAAVIGEIARELGILTVGIVSKPFQFEGARRMRTADAGIEKLEKAIDTLIVIPNQNLFRIANERTTFAEAFRLADQVLYSGIACIVDLIVKEGLINLDFADVQAVMKGMGTAMMGTGEASGEDRALTAANEAIANPLLDNITLSGAQGLLISIVGGSDLTLYEVDTAASHIRKEVAAEANIIVGATTEPGMDDRIRVSIVASGMAGQPNAAVPPVGAYSAVASSIGSSAPPPVPAPSPLPVKDEPAASIDPEPAPPAYADAGAGHDEDADVARGNSEPPPVASAGELDAAEADEFARALSEAMDATASDQASAHEAEDNWQSADGVVVEEGFGDPLGGSRPPPLPEAAESERGALPVGFEPVPPEEVRRSTPRMPVVSEFPEVAQREYYAKMEAAQKDAEKQQNWRPEQGSDGERSATNSEPPPMPLAERPSFPPRPQPAPPAPPPAKPSLLRRLTGGGRK